MQDNKCNDNSNVGEDKFLTPSKTFNNKPRPSSLNNETSNMFDIAMIK